MGGGGSNDKRQEKEEIEKEVHVGLRDRGWDYWFWLKLSWYMVEFEWVKCIRFHLRFDQIEVD